MLGSMWSYNDPPLLPSLIICVVGVLAILALRQCSEDDCKSRHCAAGTPQLVNYSCICVAAIPEPAK